MALEKGMLALIDYTARLGDSGTVYSTTREDDAKAASIHSPDTVYAPQLVAVGERWVLEGLDDALIGMSEGESATVEIAPEKGFGERDSRKVRMIPLRKLGDDAEKVSVGDSVDIDDRHGIIRFIGSGRVQIDFNHKYAGKTLVYDLRVAGVPADDAARASAIVRNGLAALRADAGASLADGTVEVLIPQQLFRNAALGATKRMIQSHIFRYAKSARRVRFVEEYEAPTGASA